MYGKVWEISQELFLDKYISGERSVFLLDIYFDADNQEEIIRTVKRLSELIFQGFIKKIFLALWDLKNF